jgi:hypothetical protein
MLFNTNKEISFKSIKEIMKFDDDTCMKNLKTLMLKGYKMLEWKTDKGTNAPLNDSDVFAINEQYSS